MAIDYSGEEVVRVTVLVHNNVENQMQKREIHEETVREWGVTSASFGEVGTGNFQGNLVFLNFPFPGKFMSGSREIFLL